MLFIVLVIAMSSCSQYFTVLDERGKIILVRDRLYKDHVNEGDTVIIAETLLGVEYYRSLYSLYVGDMPKDVVTDKHTTWYFKAVVLK